MGKSQGKKRKNVCELARKENLSRKKLQDGFIRINFVIFAPAKPKSMHIAIAGNIGSGKTTLTQRLADYYGWQPKFESVADNPYLADYYKDIPRWAFNVEVFFCGSASRTCSPSISRRNPLCRTAQSSKASMFSLSTTMKWATSTSETSIPIWNSSRT